MITRAFRATATADGADTYRQHFSRSVLPDLQRIDGYHSAYLLRRGRDGHAELQVLTLWESLEAISRFAGPDSEHAVVEPVAQAALASYDSAVTPPHRGGRHRRRRRRPVNRRDADHPAHARS